VAGFGRFIQVTLGRKMYSLNVDRFNEVHNQDPLIAPDHFTEEGFSVGGDLGKIETETLTVSSEIKCVLNIRSDGARWKGSVKLYNLSEQTSEFPFNGYRETGAGPLAHSWMRVDAGYEGDGNHGVILECMIDGIDVYREGTETITELFVGGATSHFDRKYVDVSVSKEANHLDVIKKVLTDHDMPFVDELDYEEKTKGLFKTNIPDFSYSGLLSDLLGEYLPMVSYSEYVEYYDNGRRQLWHREDVHVARYHVDALGVIHLFWDDLVKDSVKVVRISHLSGLKSLSRPKSSRGKKKLKVTHQLSHHLVKRGVIEVTTSGFYSIKKDGKYIVDEIRYTGSNYTGSFQAEMEVVPIRRPAS